MDDLRDAPNESDDSRSAVAPATSAECYVMGAVTAGSAVTGFAAALQAQYFEESSCRLRSHRQHTGWNDWRDQTAGNETEGQTKGQGTLSGGVAVRPIILGGEKDGRYGLTPNPIEGEENPTLFLQSDRKYELIWISMDGAEYEFLIPTRTRGDVNAIVRTVLSGLTTRTSAKVRSRRLLDAKRR